MWYNIGMVITSSQNNLIKEIKKLKLNRDFLFLDSPKAINEAINSNFEIKHIIIEDGKQEKFKNYNFNTVVVSSEVFKGLCSTVTSQGACAIVKVNKRQFKPPSSNYLVLDNVQDPGNVGTLIRSALAFGFNEIYLLDCASITNEKVARSTMGAMFKVKLYEMSKMEFLNVFKNKNLICGDMNGKKLSQTKLDFPIGVVVGNEGNGISNEIMALGESVAIEMENGVESLNAGVAGSVLMFECYRRINENLKGD